ncbi:1-acyl-sn-glycerol-3-phosphate acyltransferase alpha-like [Apostichopus japonicus]|uniref:1-acyl-sn-glycerol-3-phosphate acyltransferase alpha-like n=1 Tax=Stichopus japonicus TaxID=307972 RepID=UPI003AB49F61
MELEWFQIGVIVMLLALIPLYELNSSFKYYAKFLLYYSLVMIESVMVVLLSLPRGRDPHNQRWASLVMPYNALLLGLKFDVRGKENLQKLKNRPCVVVVNHQSSLDVLGLVGTDIFTDLCPIVGLAKKELVYAGTFGMCLLMIGTVFVNRMQSDTAKQTLEKVKERMRKENLKLLVFPEGTRNQEAGLLPFKKGAFHLAITAQVPVLPLVYSSYSDFYSKKEKRFTTGKVIITALPPISTEGKNIDDVPSFTEAIRKQMLFTYNESSAPRLESNGLN